MADHEAGTARPPTLQKPPGYRDPVQFANARRPPPRKPQLPPTFRQAGKPAGGRHRRRSVCCRLCLCLILLIFSLLFLLGVAGGVAYLYFQPHLPYFRLQSIQTPHFNITTKSDGSGTFLDADVVIKIFASNRNGKISVSYSEIQAAVYVDDEDGDVGLGTGTMVGFEQGRRNATVMKFTASTKPVLVDDVVGRRLKGKFGRGEMRVGAKVRTRVGLSAGRVTTGRVPVRVDCSPVSLREVKGAGVLPKCDIYLFRW